MPASYSVYRSLVQKVMLDPELLPSLPAVTLNIRQAINDDSVTSEQLAIICAQDPAFSALLMATASSPLYIQSSSPNTLAGVISLLGMPRVSSLAMSHSVKSLFILRSASVTKMYQQIWQRLMIKAGVSSFLSLKIKQGIPEKVMLAALLSEVGTLGILSALKEEQEFPSNKTFFQLCREYSKAYGALLLNKWQIDKEFIDVLKFCGRWKNIETGALNTLDIINLGLYATVKITNPRNNLPPINRIPSYKKLAPPFNTLDESGSLAIVSDHMDEIEAIQGVLS